MPPIDPNQELMPSVIDRLIDADSGGTTARRGYSVNQMTEAVRRDLTDLLNTRQSDQGVPPEFGELLSSIFGFGLPDLTSLNGATPKERYEIGNAIETIIARYEPRLQDVRATVLDPKDSVERTVRFRIDARLCMDPAPEVAFDTILELTTGRYDVKSSECDVSKSLYRHYQHELVFLRQMSQEFAKQFPAAASRLRLEENRSLDPHVERLLEGFALLSGRVQLKIDDEFPELTDALLNILYPHYLAPIPSTSVVQFDLDPERAQLPNGFVVEKHARLRTSPVGDMRCRFRTPAATTLWPVTVTDAKVVVPPFPQGWEAPPRTKSAIRIQIECSSELAFNALSLDRLRLHLVNEQQIVYTLYELLFNHAIQVAFRPLEKGSKANPVVLRPAEALFPVGFDSDEALLPFPPHSFPGYRLLAEFFGTPVKFFFADLGGFRRVRAAGFSRKLEAIIYLDRRVERLDQAIDAGTFRLHCAPIINLFEQTAEPIPLTQTRSEYRIVPDVAHPHGLEVYSVESVTGVTGSGAAAIEYQPFYSFRHGGDRMKNRQFWYARRREATGENDRGTDVYLSLVDLDFNPNVPDEKSLIVRTLCTNRDLPGQLRHATQGMLFELEQAAPIHRVICLRAPSLPMRPPSRRGAYWRLISHLSLNHLSLGGGEGRAALQEMLRLYDFTDPELNQQQAAVLQQMIDGITNVRSRPVVGRMAGAAAAGFCRGTEVTIEFDETKYVDNPLFLFASVLERFLGLYVSINSFTQMVATTAQGQAVIKKWPPRAGEQPLV